MLTFPTLDLVDNVGQIGRGSGGMNLASSEHHKAMALVLNGASEVEAKLASLVASLTGADTEDVILIYTQERNSSLQERMINALVDRHCRPKERAIFRTIRSNLKGPVKARNALVHSVFGFLHHPPQLEIRDEVLLISLDEHVRYHQHTSKVPFAGHYVWNRKKILVADVQTTHKLASIFATASTCLEHFVTAVSSDDVRREQEIDSLLDNPFIKDNVSKSNQMLIDAGDGGPHNL